MNCANVGRQLSDFALDDVASCDTLELASHLRECADCAKRIERDRSVTMLLREWSEPEFGDMDRERLRVTVRSAIAEEARGSRRVGVTVRLATAASIAALTLLLGLAGVSRVGGPTDDEAMAGPATRIEDTEPGVFTMVGPFSAKERIEPRKPVDRLRRPESKARRVSRRIAEPVPMQPTPVLGTTPVDSDSMMRFEFQTQDPKIRIIWFVPRADNGTSTTSEIGD